MDAEILMNKDSQTLFKDEGSLSFGSDNNDNEITNDVNNEYNDEEDDYNDEEDDLSVLSSEKENIKTSTQNVH